MSLLSTRGVTTDYRLAELDRAIASEGGWETRTKHHAKDQSKRIREAGDRQAARIRNMTFHMIQHERELRMLVAALRAHVAGERRERECFQCAAPAWCEHREPGIERGGPV